MGKVIYYNPKLKELARRLRNESTLSEVLLWNQLKRGQMHNYDFNRQKPIDNYIVDFFCLDLMLAIEIDGSTHGDKIENDKVRQKRLENLGIRVLRFSDMEVKQNMDSVLERISDWIKENADRYLF